MGRVYNAQPFTGNQRDRVGIICPPGALNRQPTNVLESAEENGYLHKAEYPQSNSFQSYTCRAPLIFQIGSPNTHTLAFWMMYANLTNCGFNIGCLKSGLLKKEYILVFLFLKYNIAPSFTKTKVYSKDVMLLSWISWRRSFNVADIMYTSMIHCMM